MSHELLKGCACVPELTVTGLTKNPEGCVHDWIITDVHDLTVLYTNQGPCLHVEDIQTGTYVCDWIISFVPFKVHKGNHSYSYTYCHHRQCVSNKSAAHTGNTNYAHCIHTWKLVHEIILVRMFT